MNADLRIPVTAALKQLVQEAAGEAGLAAWARPILENAARAAILGRNKKTQRKAGVSSPSAQADPSASV